MSEADEGCRYFAESVEGSIFVGGGIVAVTAEFGPSSKYTCVTCKESFESLALSSWVGQTGKCPKCGTVNTPIISNVPFSRAQVTPTPPEEPKPKPEPEPKTKAKPRTRIKIEVEVEKTPKSAKPPETSKHDAPPAKSKHDAPPAKSKHDAPPAKSKRGKPPAKPEPDATPLEMDGEFLLAKPSENQTSDGSVIQGLPLKADDDSEVPILADPGKSPADAEEPPKERAAEIQEDGWFFRLKDKKHGPATIERLKKLQAAGTIDGDTMIWRDGMDISRPLDTFDELRLSREPASPAEETSAPEEHAAKRDNHQHSRDIINHCNRLLWMLAGAVGLVVVVLITRQTFIEMGESTFLTVGLVLAVGICGAAAFGVWGIVRNLDLFRTVYSAIRLRGILGIVGLVGCLVIILYAIATV